MEMSQKGCSDKEISIYLNASGIKTPRNKIYTPSLVWGTRKKLRLREERKGNTHFEINSLSIFFK
jgi:hypothetical protein